MALMNGYDRSEMLHAIGIIFAVSICVIGAIFALVWMGEWAQENEARRCVEYGYYCPKED